MTKAFGTTARHEMVIGGSQKAKNQKNTKAFFQKRLGNATAALVIRGFQNALLPKTLVFGKSAFWNPLITKAFLKKRLRNFWPSISSNGNFWSMVSGWGGVSRVCAQTRVCTQTRNYHLGARVCAQTRNYQGVCAQTPW